MIVKLDGVRKIHITGEYIRLDALLKFASLVSTGGEAKFLIRSGMILVDGKPCTQRGRKITAGCTVRCNGETLIVA